MTNKDTTALEAGRVILNAISEANMGEVSELKCSVDQRQFTNSPLWALLQTGFGYRKELRATYAVCLVDKVIGMITVENREDCYLLTDFLIDVSEQRKGYGIRALELILRKCGTERLYKLVVVHIDPENNASKQLALKAGFADKGVSDVGYATMQVFEYRLPDIAKTAPTAYTPPKYVRVQTRETAWLTGKPRGIFAAVSHLDGDGKLTEDESAIFRCLDKVYFEEHLPNPPFYDDDSRPKPITWFKTAESAHFLDKLQPLMDMLDRNSVPYDVVYTNAPGNIVYEDEWQIAAL